MPVQSSDHNSVAVVEVLAEYCSQPVYNVRLLARNGLVNKIKFLWLMNDPKAVRTNEIARSVIIT